MSGREYPDRPRIGVGALVLRDNRVLLVCRGVAPGRGLWAIPGGSLELGETLQQAAEREIFEETGIRIRADEPLYVFDVIERDDQGRIRFHYVVIDLRAEEIGGDLRAADDALEARWLSAEDLTAMTVTGHTLRFLRQVGFIDAGKGQQTREKGS